MDLTIMGNAGWLFSISLGGTTGAQTIVSNLPPTNLIAMLTPMNAAVNGLKTSGEARFAIHGDVLTITIDVINAAPWIEHWQQFHGFKDNRDTTCPTEATDANHDGIIDLIETGSNVGTTMVPFNKDLAAMKVLRPSARRKFHYREMVSLKDLSAASRKAFVGQGNGLKHRIVFIHDVVPASKLPASVASLGPIPAHVTLPIACGKIKHVAV